MAKHKILIAEDEKPLAQALYLKLTNSGFDVEIASDGEKAVEMINANSYSLVILDLIMPKLDGFGVLGKIDTKKVPVIVVSNLSQEEDVKRVKDLGAAEYFVKANVPIADIVAYIHKKLT